MSQKHTIIRIKSAKKRPLRFLPLVLAALALLPCCSKHPRPSSQPNLLLITIDTLRADRLGCTGRTKACTPIMDSLASEGVLFDCCIVSAPITLPSHSTIMTGLLPHEMGVRDNQPFSLSGDAETLAEKLGRRGYETCAVVSAETVAPGCGLEQGFDRYIYQPLPRKGKTLLEETPADSATAQALGAAKQVNAAQPFFMWVHYFDPHIPYEPPERIRNRFEDPYDGEVAFVDEQIGKLLSGLEKMGHLERTVLVVTSDHGEGLGEHGEPTHAFFLFDSTLKVPLIIKGPGIKGNRRCKSQVRSMDLGGALLGLVTLEAETAPSVSTEAAKLLSFLLSSGTRLRSAPAFSESLYCFRNFQWAQMSSLRTDDLKLIRGARDEFFNPYSDPGEMEPAPPGTWTVPPFSEEERGRLSPPEFVRVMDRVKLDAKSIFARGDRFHLDLPGYFGGTLKNSRLFLEERLNRRLAHPTDRSGFINDLLRAVALSDSGSINQARLILNKLIEENPDNPTALYWMGRVLRETGEIEGDPSLIKRAHAVFGKVLEIDPENLDAFHMSVWCLLQTGSFEMAKSSLDIWAQKNEPLATTWELYGYLYSSHRSGGMSNPCFDIEKGFTCFDRALNAKRNNPHLLQKLVQLCKKQNKADLQKMYEEQLRKIRPVNRK